MAPSLEQASVKEALAEAFTPSLYKAHAKPPLALPATSSGEGEARSVCYSAQRCTPEGRASSGALRPERFAWCTAPGAPCEVKSELSEEAGPNLGGVCPCHRAHRHLDDSMSVRTFTGSRFTILTPDPMPCGRKRKRHKIATHKRKKRLRKNRHKKKSR